jgi:hypothetical protein
MDYTNRPTIDDEIDACETLRAAIHYTCDGELPETYELRMHLLLTGFMRVVFLVTEVAGLSDEQRDELQLVLNCATGSALQLSRDELTYSPPYSNN